MNIVKIIDATRPGGKTEKVDTFQNWVTHWCNNKIGDQELSKYLGFFCLTGLYA